MDILQWDIATQKWKTAVPFVDQLNPGYIDPTFDQDVKIVGETNGLILSSPTKFWRLTINDSGTLLINEVVPL